MARYAEDGVLMTSAKPGPTVPTVSSMAGEIHRHVRDLAVIPPAGLTHWLPGLGVPTGWNIASVDLGPVQPARILTHRSAPYADSWDGCEVINLFRFTGAVPDSVVQDSADRTLRDLGAAAPLTYRVSTPPELGITAVRSRSTADVGPHRIWGQITNFVVTVAGHSALIEHTVLIETQARTQLAGDVRMLGEEVRSALLASMHTARQARARL